MTRRRGPIVLFVLLAAAAPALAEPKVELRPAAPSLFRLFPDLEGAAAHASFLEAADAVARESLLRLPGDSDSVLTLGGPAPSGVPRLRLAVEVNEAALKLLAPDPRVESADTRSRAGGDWKPIDAVGRPYQLRLGARLIW